MEHSLEVLVPGPPVVASLGRGGEQAARVKALQSEKVEQEQANARTNT